MSDVYQNKSINNNDKPTVAILLGSLAHPRLAASFKHIFPRYNVIIVSTRSAYATAKAMLMPVQALTGLSDIISRIPKIKRLIHWGPDQYLLGLDKIIDNVDIVFSHSPIARYSYQAALACKRLNKPFIVQEVEIIPFRDLSSRMITTCREHVLEAATLVTTVTQRARALLLIENVPANKIRVVPYGVDTDIFYPTEIDINMRKHIGVDAQDTVLLFAGRAEWAKGIFELVHALKLLNEDPCLSEHNLRLIIPNHGCDMDLLKKHIAHLNIGEMIKCIQPVNYKDMPRLYRMANMIVAPSIPAPRQREQWGLVLSEAMACGIPVITTLCGGIPEVVGDCALVVQPGDALSLAEAIKNIITNTTLQKQLSDAGRKRCLEIFDSRIVGEQYANLLDEALAI